MAIEAGALIVSFVLARPHRRFWFVVTGWGVNSAIPTVSGESTVQILPARSETMNASFSMLAFYM